MTIPSWPAIPYASDNESFQQPQLTNPGLRTDMNAGTTRQRRKYTLQVTTQQIALVLTAAEWSTFCDFYEDDLGEGSARFTMPVWNGSEFVTCTVAIKTDVPVSMLPMEQTGRRRVGFTVLVENIRGGVPL